MINSLWPCSKNSLLKVKTKNKIATLLLQLLANQIPSFCNQANSLTTFRIHNNSLSKKLLKKTQSQICLKSINKNKIKFQIRALDNNKKNQHLEIIQQVKCLNKINS